MNSPDNQHYHRIFNSFIGLLILTGIGKIFGFVEKQIIAYYFGTAWQVDVYFFVMNLSLVLYILFEEIIQPAFIPWFISLKNENNIKAFQLFNGIFVILVLLLAGLVMGGTAFSSRLIHILAPGFQGEKLLLASQLFKILALAMGFNCLGVLLYYLLNSFKSFLLPAVAQTVFKIISALGIVVFVNALGVKSLPWAFLIAVIIKFAILAAGIIVKKAAQFTAISLARIEIKQLALLVLPLVIGAAFAQISLRVDDYFASQLPEGMLAALQYAKKVVDMPLLIIPYSLSLVVFPYLSEYAQARNTAQGHEKIQQLFTKWFEILIFIFILLELYFIIMSTPLIQLIFQRGQFTVWSTALTNRAFLCYALGMVSFAIEMLVMQVFFAFADTKTPVAVGIICVILNICFTIILIAYFQHMAIALAYTIQKTVKIIILFCLLKKHLILFKPGYLKKLGARISIPIMISLMVMLAVKSLMHPLLIMPSILVRSGSVITIFIIFIGTALMLMWRQKDPVLIELTADIHSLMKKRVLK